jgi:deoxyribodipyrimidine photo-lyase
LIIRDRIHSNVDIASNPGNAQWVAGSGAVAAPYFRIFNPVLQKFDPAGDYVHRFVAELGALDPQHHPGAVSHPALRARRARRSAGKTYPEPIVAHDAARLRALTALAKVKSRDS